MIILEPKDFSLQQTLECGQVFRFKKIDENEYYLHAKEYVAHLKQKDNILEITSNYEDESFWTNYFDLNTDYSKIKKELSKNKNLLPAINYGYGIHILRQDFSEMLISFIMSQNKQIPQIKQCVELYCQKFGEKIVFEGKEFFTFPKVQTLPSIEEIKECKVGFRDKYILDALEKEINGYFENIDNLSEKEQEEKLLSVKGIGPKVTACIMLFGLSRTNRFPIDVWVQRKMQDLYFEGNTKDKETIQKKAEDLFGNYKGYAQQYMFFAGINNII